MDTIKETKPSVVNMTPLPGSLLLIDGGWNIFKKRPIVSIISLFFPLLLSTLLYFGLIFTVEEIESGKLFVWILYYILSSTITIGMITLLLKITREQAITANDMIAKIHRVFHVLLGQVIMQVIIFIGFIFFLIPGILFSVRFVFVGTLIVDTELGIIDAFRTSWHMTRGRFWALFGRSIVISFLLGCTIVFTAGIGAIIAAPVGVFIYLSIYDMLKPKEIASV